MKRPDKVGFLSRIGLGAMHRLPKHMSAEEARAFMKKSEAGRFALLDVREPKEYESDHIPGAKLMPLAGLLDSLKELDRRKPTIVYCAVGGRSSVAVRMLADRGFDDVYNLQGGIRAWKGEKVSGPVDLHLRFLETYDTIEKIMSMTYNMESALAGFYRDLAGNTSDEETERLLVDLTAWEEKHKADILKISADLVLDRDAVKRGDEAAMIEGGFDGKTLLAEQGELLGTSFGILEVSMMIEATAMDLYLRIAEALKENKASEAFRRIGDEEKKHLERLGRLLEEKTAAGR